jgi:hypothetical protein
MLAEDFTWHECEEVEVLVEPDVVEPGPDAGRSAQDAHATGYHAI